MGKRKIPCPVCRNSRLFDIEDKGQTQVEIKCPLCRNLIRITVNNKIISTEQIGT